MKDLETKERFVELRAQGRSFDSIADELKMSKTTLIKWSRELEKEINNAQYLAYQRLIEQYKLTKIERADLIMQALQRVNDAIGQKDVNAMSIKELLMLSDKLENQLNSLTLNVEYRTGETINVKWDDQFKLNGEQEITLKLE